MPIPREFSDKVTYGIDFTDEAVVQCNFPVAKIFLELIAISKRQ